MAGGTMKCLSARLAACRTFLGPEIHRVLLSAGFQDYKRPPAHEDVEFPPPEIAPNNKLRITQKVPPPPANMKPPWRTGRGIEFMRGPEEVHTSFIHKQFGIVATSGGMLKHGHFDMIRNTINRKLDTNRMFAIWRVDPPWWPVVKHSGRMGGGKSPINHYMTPVKAGRVIIEIGGKLDYEEIRALLENVAARLPFQAIATAYTDMEKAKRLEQQKERLNLNPFTMEYVIKNNMGGCSKWLSPYDYRWYCKHR